MPDRTIQALDEMEKLYSYANVEYEIIRAIQNKDKPWKGLSDTIKKIVKDNYEKPFIHIFEDDVRFTSDRSREYFELIFKNLPSDWDIFLGGAYTRPEQYEKKMPIGILSTGGDSSGRNSESIITGGWVKMRSFSSLHCAVIRKSVYDLILNHDAEGKKHHIDYYLSEEIRKGLNVYLCDPTIAIQYPGYSHLQKADVNYIDFENQMNILR